MRSASLTAKSRKRERLYAPRNCAAKDTAVFILRRPASSILDGIACTGSQVCVVLLKHMPSTTDTLHRQLTQLRKTFPRCLFGCWFK